MLEFPIVSNVNNSNVYNLLIIENRIDDENYKVLVDTGASIPVWVDGEEVFKYFYPDAIQSEKKAYIGGFGGNGEIVDVFIVPIFIIGDGRDNIVFKDIPIAVTDRDFSFQMIMSFTMLNKLQFEYSIDKVDTTCTKPILLIDSNNTEYRSIPTYMHYVDKSGVRREFISGLDVFIQE